MQKGKGSERGSTRGREEVVVKGGGEQWRRGGRRGGREEGGVSRRIDAVGTGDCEEEGNGVSLDGERLGD